MQAILLSCVFFFCVIVLLKCHWNTENSSTIVVEEPQQDEIYLAREWFLEPNAILDPGNSKLLLVLSGQHSKDTHLKKPNDALQKSGTQETYTDFTTTEPTPDNIGDRLSAKLLKVLT